MKKEPGWVTFYFNYKSWSAQNKQNVKALSHIL